MVIKKQILLLFYLSVFFLQKPSLNFASEIKECSIPDDIASINLKNDYEDNRLIYYIHDAHCQPEAQYAIAKIIGRIIKYHGYAVVAVEGAQGRYNIDRFKKFPDKKALIDVSKQFVENGSISGAEYLSLTSDKEFLLTGAENRDYYIENYNCMTSLLKIQHSAVRSIEYLIEQSLSLAQVELSREQNKFIEKWSKYKRSEIELKDFSEYLSELYKASDKDIKRFGEIEKYLNTCRVEKNINVNAVEAERLAFFDWFTAHADKTKLAGLFTTDLNFQLQKITPKEYFDRIINLAQSSNYDKEFFKETITYTKYLDMVASLDSVSFHNQLKECISEIRNVLFTTGRECQIIEYICSLYDLNNLAGLHIINADLDNLLGFGDVEKFKVVTAKIFNSDLSGKVNWNILTQAYQCGLDFYSKARARDSVMVENLLSAMQSQGCPVGVIIAGGFHQQGICGELDDKQISYRSLKPSLIKVKDNSRYIALIRNTKTPLERWVSGSTLAVASWLSENPLVNRSAKQVKTAVFSSMLISASVNNMFPEDIILLRENLSDLMDRAQLYLESWMKQYAPQIEISHLLFINDRLSVELSVNNRKIVFLFDTLDSQGQDFPVDDGKILEQTDIGGDTVTVVTYEVAEQIKKLSEIERNIKNGNTEQDNIEKVFERLGLLSQYKANKLSITGLINKVNELSENAVTVSLQDYYTALRWLILNQRDIFTTDDTAHIVGRDKRMFEQFDVSLNPSDIIALAYDLLKQVNSGEGMLNVADLPVVWYDILSAKKIGSIAFAYDVPYEAVVRMLFNLVFLPEYQPGVVSLGSHNGREYQMRIIKLDDGSMMVRIVSGEPFASQKSFFNEPFKPDDDAPLDAGALKDGLLLIEIDGGFVLSDMLAFDDQSGELSYTYIKDNIVGLNRGDKGVSKLRDFIGKMFGRSMEQGYIPRGIIFRNQSGEPKYFADENRFIDYIKNELSSLYLPLQQTGWADETGNLKDSQLVDFMNKGVRCADIGGGYENFQDIEKIIDLKGKTVLDVGSQLGYNVFYAYLKGAEFAVGVDINPYQQQAAREISAYLQDNLQVPFEQVGDRIPDLVVAPQGITQGQLFFRLVDIKEYEDAHDVSLATKPPDNIELSIADARNLPYEDNSFDVVLSQYLLSYIKNPSLAIAEMLRVVKPGGIVRFNYSFIHETDMLILEEACKILARNHNIHIDYSFVGLSTESLLMRVNSKTKTEDVFAETGSEKLKFTQKSSSLPNTFDRKPYLQSLYPPISAVPENYYTVAEAPFTSLNLITGIDGQEKVSLIFAKQMLGRLYNSELFNGLSSVEISRGSSELVSIINDRLVIDESALSNPHILFSLMEQALVRRFINDMPIEFFRKNQVPDEQVLLYKDVIFVYYFTEQIINRFSEHQVRQIISGLRGSAEKDTSLEFQADMLGKMLERSLIKPMSSRKLIYDILRELLNLPQYESLKTTSKDLGDLFDTDVVSLSVIDNIDNLAGNLKNLFTGSYSNPDFSFEVMSEELLSRAAESVNPDSSIKEYMDFLPYLKKIKQFGADMPANLSELLNEEMFNRIFQQFPAVGFYFIKDMIKSVINDPGNPAQAPFLMNLDSTAIMSIIQNISRSIEGKLPEFKNGVEHAIPILETMPASAWIGSRLNSKLIELNNGEPYRVLNMELETENEEKFLKKLNNIALLNKIGANEIVALKITRKVNVDGGKGLDVYIVVDTLDEIYKNSQLVAGFATFLEHEMSYKKTFSIPQNSTKSSFISFSYDVRSAGIGSEFVRNEIALFQECGMVKTAVKAISKEIKVYSMIERELGAEVVMDSLWDTILPDSGLTREFAALLFRIGVLNSYQLDEVWDLATKEEDVTSELKSIFNQAIKDERQKGESVLHMFNRRTMQFVRKRARLEQIIDIYEDLLKEPLVTVNFPEIQDEYNAFQNYKDLAIETPVYNIEPLTLGMERRLIEKIPEFEDSLLSYMNNDLLGYVVIPNSLFTKVLDITETYDEFSSYVARVLPFIDLLGTIPDQVRPDNVFAHVSLILRTAAHLSAQRKPQDISEMLQSENIWSSLADNTNKIQKETLVTQAVQSLFYALLQEKTLSITIRKYFRFFKKKGLFDGELLAHSGQWAVNVIQANPNGAKVVFLSLASLFVDNQQEAVELFERLMAVEGADFVTLVHYAGSVDSNTFITQLPDLLTVFESGIRERLDILIGAGGEKFGRLNLLAANNSVIKPDVLDHSKFVMQIANRQSDKNGLFTEGFSSFELAENLFQELTEKGIGVKLMKGVSTISGEDQFFLQIGSVNIGISPFAEFINPDYNDVKAVDPAELKEMYETDRSFVPLTANEPLIWRNLNRRREIYFTGRMETVSIDGTDYIDITIESKMRSDDGSLSPQISTLRIPKANLFDLYDAVISNDSAETLQSILRFKHADLSFTSSTDEPEIAKSRAIYFNDIFYQLISHMDPVWLYNEKINNAVAGFTQMDPVSLADKMDIVRYGDISNIAQQIVLRQQIIEPEQPASSNWNPDRIDISNTLNPDFSVILMDSFPVGYTVGAKMHLIEPLQYAVPVLKEKIAQGAGHSFSPFVKTDRENITFTNIAVFNATEYGSLSVETDIGFNTDNFDKDYYSQEISRALINIGFNIKDMFAENISIQLVQRHWRLGDRQVNITDGSITLIIDIDALRDPLLLEFILRHELLPHSGAAGEAYALLNDVFHFKSLSSQRQQRLLSVLRNQNVDLKNFADILEQSIEKSPLGIISDIADYVSDPEKYPQLSLELKGMSGDDLYRYLSHNFNDEFASELETMDISALDVLKLTIHPKFYDLSVAFDAIKQLGKNPAFPAESARQTAVSYLLYNKLNADDLAESFYNMDMDTNRASFNDLFFLFGHQIVPVLLRNAQADTQRLSQFESFMITFAKVFGDTFLYSINFKTPDQFLRIVFERGDTNVERFYTVNGDLYSQHVYDHVDWYSAIPEQTEQIANLCEDIFGKNLENIVMILDDLLEEPENHEKLKRKIQKYNDKLHNLVEQMMDDYRKVKTARNYLDLRNIPLSKREIAVSINTQFASDLIGSPISYGLGMMQMAEIEINQANEQNREINYDDVLNFLNLGYENFTNLRQLIVRYRIIRDYRIALNDDNYMIKFEQSMAIDANTQVRDSAFYPESAVAEQIKSRMNSGNDVYAVYFSGHETNSIRFISNLMDKIDSGKIAKIVVVSSNLDTDVLESLLSEFNITQASALILGKDILAKSDKQAVSGADIISAIEQNVQTVPDNIIFLSDQTKVFYNLMKEGVTVLPLPDIKQIPKPYSPELGSKSVIDRAA